MVEEYKIIDGYEDYMISNYGKVFNIKRGKFLKLSKNKDGYFVVNLYKNGKLKHFRVHRLVAKAFIPNPDNLDTVDHIGSKTDNRVCNLRWLSNYDNISRFHREQKTEEQRTHYRENIKRATEKASEVNKKPVICLETGKIYESARQAEKELNINHNCISGVCRGELKQTHGLHFEYLLKE